MVIGEEQYKWLLSQYSDNVREFIKPENFTIGYFNSVPVSVVYDGQDRYIICSATLNRNTKLFDELFKNWHQQLWLKTRKNEVPWYKSRTAK